MEAGVGLLSTCFGGRFAQPGWPWVQAGTDPGWWWVDVDQLTPDQFGMLSGGEQRVLRIAASLLGGEPVSLYETLPGIDGEQFQLVQAAIDRASGNGR